MDQLPSFLFSWLHKILQTENSNSVVSGRNRGSSVSIILLLEFDFYYSSQTESPPCTLEKDDTHTQVHCDNRGKGVSWADKKNLIE